MKNIDADATLTLYRIEVERIVEKLVDPRQTRINELQRVSVNLNGRLLLDKQQLVSEIWARILKRRNTMPSCDSLNLKVSR